MIWSRDSFMVPLLTRRVARQSVRCDSSISGSTTGGDFPRRDSHDLRRADPMGERRRRRASKSALPCGAWGRGPCRIWKCVPDLEDLFIIPHKRVPISMSWDCRSRKSNGTIQEENSEFGFGAGAELRTG